MHIVHTFADMGSLVAATSDGLVEVNIRKKHTWTDKDTQLYTCMYMHIMYMYDTIHIIIMRGPDMPVWALQLICGSYPKASYLPVSSTLFYIEFATYLGFNRRTMGAYTSGNKSSHTWVTSNKYNLYYVYRAHATMYVEYMCIHVYMHNRSYTCILCNMW